jgi:hypothetical protein
MKQELLQCTPRIGAILLQIASVLVLALKNAHQKHLQIPTREDWSSGAASHKSQTSKCRLDGLAEPLCACIKCH